MLGVTLRIKEECYIDNGRGDSRIKETDSGGTKNTGRRNGDGGIAWMKEGFEV